MTKEEAIKILRHWGSNTPAIDRDCAVKMAIEALEKPEPHWIPITERLPQVNEEVLITLSFGDIITMGWINKDGEWLIYEGNVNADINDILAWQPLPEPYKEVME